MSVVHSSGNDNIMLMAAVNVSRRTSATTQSNADDEVGPNIFVDEEFSQNDDTDLSEDEDGHAADEDGGSTSNIPTRKVSISPAPDGNEIGAVPVAEIAPQVNRRFYMGLDRASVVRARNLRRRQERARRRGQGAAAGGDGNTEAQMPHNGGESETRGTQSGGVATDGNHPSGSSNTPLTISGVSNLLARVSARNFVEATLVEENEGVVYGGVVYEAEQVGFFERKWKLIAFGMCFLLVLMATLLSVLLIEDEERTGEEQPTMVPSSAPTFTPGPTLQIVQKRGRVRCGLLNNTKTKFELNLVSCVPPHIRFTQLFPSQIIP